VSVLKRWVLVLFALLFAATACATTNATISGVAPTYNQMPGSCAESPDTLRDLKEILLRRRVMPSGPFIEQRQPANEGQPFSFFLSNIAEAVWGFWVYAVDDSGNVSCADSLVKSYVRVPSKPKAIQASP
jgi:hypothetical protein